MCSFYTCGGACQGMSGGVNAESFFEEEAHGPASWGACSGPLDARMWSRSSFLYFSRMPQARAGLEPPGNSRFNPQPSSSMPVFLPLLKKPEAEARSLVLSLQRPLVTVQQLVGSESRGNVRRSTVVHDPSGQSSLVHRTVNQM